MLEVKPPPVPSPTHSDTHTGLSIAEAAHRTGVSVHTLRYYERAGLTVTPSTATTPGGAATSSLICAGSLSAPSCGPPACP